MELVHSVCKSLAPALRRSFKFSEPNFVERCRDLLQEPHEVRKERELIEQKLRRLVRAEEKVRDSGSMSSPHVLAMTSLYLVLYGHTVTTQRGCRKY